MWFLSGCAVIVIGLVVEQAISPGSPHVAQKPLPPAPWAGLPSSVPATGSPSPSASSGGQPAALTGPLDIVHGKREIDGVYLGFPHTAVGAVSAADEDAIELFSTLDPDEAASVMRMIADPSWTDAPEVAASGPVNDRKALSLPTSGPVPQGASQEVEPVEYQARNVGADQALVLLLCNFVTTTPDQGTSTYAGVFPFAMRWDEDDWKVVSINATKAEPNLAATPYSAKAAANGWQQLEAPAGG